MNLLHVRSADSERIRSVGFLGVRNDRADCVLDRVLRWCGNLNWGRSISETFTGLEEWSAGSTRHGLIELAFCLIARLGVPLSSIWKSFTLTERKLHFSCRSVEGRSQSLSSCGVHYIKFYFYFISNIN